MLHSFGKIRMKKDFRVLMLEDSTTDAELIKRELEKSNFSMMINRVVTKEKFSEALQGFNPDLILSDYNLPSFDGLSALAIAKETTPFVPFIFVSGAIGEDRAIEALKNGATDYVLKDRLSRLIPSVERALKEISQRLAREEMQERLQSSEARFKAFMDHNPAMAFLKTQEGCYIYANQPFENRFNIERKDWLGKTDFDFWPQEISKRFYDHDQQVLVYDKSFEMTEDVPMPDGQLHSWLIFKFPVDCGQRKLIGGMAIDVTEQKRTESQLKKAVGELARLNAELDKKNDELKKLDQLKSDFVSTVSHELRTPMTIMRESISQIIDRLCGDLTSLQEKRLFMTLNNIDRLRHIVDNLLDVSKYESNKTELHKEVIDLVQLIKEMGFSFESQIKNKGLQIEYDFSGDRVEISVDRDKLIQVLVNLISNAIKFTETGYVKISIQENEKEIECRVKDSGRGIQQEELPKVFDKFQQFGRQEGPGDRGTGLGLTICKEIIKLHHGEIWIESTPGEGTTIGFTLPKFSMEELFLEDLSVHLRNIFQNVEYLSVLIFEINNFRIIQQELGQEEINSLEKEFVRLIKQCLRRQADRIVCNDRFILIILPETKKDQALMVSGRIQQVIDDLLVKNNLRSKIEMTVKAAEYPQEGKTAHELLNKVGLL